MASKLKEPIHDSNFEYIKKFVDSKVDNNVSFSIPEINIAFVRKYILNLDISKSTGLDDIGPRILKLSYDIISPSITFLINKSLSLGIFQNVWKTANIIPIHKTGPKEDVNNYRPISILPTVSKIMEKWIHLKFMNYLNDNKLLHEKQSGFRAGHSTESALILLIDSWLKAINEGKFVGCVMIDFRKTFHLVDHAVLLKKLEIYKCGKSALSWFKSYLSTRTQKVSIKHSNSDTENITCGVPQGSILGPLLFLIFINDPPLKLQNIVAPTDLYADDTTIYDIQYDKQVLENILKDL